MLTIGCFVNLTSFRTATLKKLLICNRQILVRFVLGSSSREKPESEKSRENIKVSRLGLLTTMTVLLERGVCVPAVFIERGQRIMVL